MESTIPLPEPASEGGAPIWTAMTERRSVRFFGEEPMPLSVLSQLIWSTHGITGRVGNIELRNAPSAGACYPIDVYVVANNVEGLEEGLYRYLTSDHSLVLVKDGDVGSEIANAALGQKMCRDGSVSLVWTAVIPRTTGRYGERGHRYIFLDAGHVGQNAYLAATALGYGCCTVGAFDDAAMNEAVGVDGEIERVVYLAAVGPLG